MLLLTSWCVLLCLLFVLLLLLLFFVCTVFQYLLGQKKLGLTDISKATITEKSVRLNYVHGIWYQVRGMEQWAQEGCLHSAAG